ncbi:MAG: nhaA [Alphaproteobacteria bacterium]|nr:nhaA [Alphaproteobacteria bacterium]
MLRRKKAAKDRLLKNRAAGALRDGIGGIVAKMGKSDGAGRIRGTLANFLESEAGGSILLIACAASAVVLANSRFADLYHHLLHRPIGPALSARLGPLTPHLLINDGLMALFFLLVGLEIKREFADGHLATWKQRRLPVLAAAAGMAAPAAIYLVAVGGRAELASGWAIPAATDIAFALGVVALLGRRVPASLKLFLTTVAIVDDLGAVAIIALAYTASLDPLALGAAAVILFVMYVAGKSGVTALWVYMLLAFALWYAILSSGVHATVAGVLAAATIPITAADSDQAAVSPLHRLEGALAPLVAFLIVPLFAFANAGVSFAQLGWADLVSPLPFGIAAGLFIGKQIGVFGVVWLAVRTGFAAKPADASWPQLYGIALMCGIGFTMSLFIGALAFPGEPALVEEAKIGVLLGSLASAIAGYAVLRLVPTRSGKATPPAPAH